MVGLEYNSRFRASLLCGASIVTILGLSAPIGAWAQTVQGSVARGAAETAPATPAQDAAASQLSDTQSSQPSETSDIVVSGTRIIRDGFRAPTPVSVLGAEQLAAKAPNNIADALNELPSLGGANTPRSNGSFASNGQMGINALNLRNLNPNRTLVLVDGQRIGTSTLTGITDVNQIPQALVKRVDIVTGGASASWGSDAVSGVVNFVLDRDFTGLKGQVQGGVTDYGDGRNFNVSLTGGASFAGDRGHVVVNGEIAHNDQIRGIGNRKWYNGRKVLFNPAYTATNGQPQLLVRDNVGVATVAPGGLILSGPLRGTYFGPGGNPGTLNFGSLVSGNYFVGGDWQFTDYAQSASMQPALSRQSIFGLVSYDLTEDVEIYGMASYTNAEANAQVVANRFLGNLTIQPDNAFIPGSVAGRVTGPFTFGTTNSDLPLANAANNRSSSRGVLGGRGKFQVGGSEWSWDVYGQRTVNRIYSETNSVNTQRYSAAIDAVRNASGTIVCRSTLANPTNGCVPFNPFGEGVNSQAGVNYVYGTSWGRTRLTQSVAAATLRGEPFSTWAGPVSVATGVEYRKESVSGSNDPLSTARPYLLGNFRATFGSYTVKEGFLETVIPLAKDASFAHSFDLNAAIRATDYSISGYVTTWKLGATYSPIEDITFRVTRSRDIRAPNLAELFATAIPNTVAIADPFRNNATASFVAVASGNLALKPEKADTLGLGVVVQPRVIPGLAASVDFYDIRIDDAIQTPSVPNLVNGCFAGNTAFCSQITRDTSGVITGANQLPINLAKQIARGIDFEVSYRRPLLEGEVAVRLLATRYLKNYSNNGINKPTDTVGKNSADTSIASDNGAGSTSLPKWRFLANIAWDRDPVTLSFTARGFSSGVYNPAFVECTSACPTSTTDNMTIDSNGLPGAVYFDANVAVKLPGNIEAFVSVDNIANKDPAQVGYGPNLGGPPLPLNAALYDTLGRAFRAGLRFKM